MPRIFPLVIVGFLVVGAGVWHGIHTNRWSLSNEPAASAAKLNDLPTTLGKGEWVKDPEEQPIEAEELELGEIAGYKNLVYRNGNNAVGVLIVCGRPGPIGVHTPDICFSGAGWKEADEAPFTVKLSEKSGGSVAEFRTARFIRGTGPDRQQKRVLWSWTADGVEWSAPGGWDRKWKYASAPALYKIYVTFGDAGSTKLSDNDPNLAPVRLLLEDLQLHRRLAPGS